MLSSPYRVSAPVPPSGPNRIRFAFQVIQGCISALLITMAVTATTTTTADCTPTQAASAVQLSVDACTEISDFVPPTSVIGQVVGLSCQAIEAGASVVQVIVDASVWNSMKAAYVVAHGALPARYAKVDAGK
jgi:hypothetical protein